MRIGDIKRTEVSTPTFKSDAEVLQIYPGRER